MCTTLRKDNMNSGQRVKKQQKNWAKPDKSLLNVKVSRLTNRGSHLNTKEEEVNKQSLHERAKYRLLQSDLLWCVLLHIYCWLMTPKMPYNGYTKSTTTGQYSDLTVGDVSDLTACWGCGVVRSEGQTHTGCVMSFHWPCKSTQHPATWGRREDFKEGGSKVIKTKDGEQRSFKPKRERKKKRQEGCGRAVSAPVHQRFYILFIHNDVVDCCLLLHLDHLLLLLLFVIVLKGVWARRSCFSGCIQADDTEHSKKWVCDMHTHTKTHLWHRVHL